MAEKSYVQQSWDSMALVGEEIEIDSTATCRFLQDECQAPAEWYYSITHPACGRTRSDPFCDEHLEEARRVHALYGNMSSGPCPRCGVPTTINELVPTWRKI